MILGPISGPLLTAANYAVAAVLCLLAARRSPRSSRAWIFLAGAVLLLLANKAFGIEFHLAAAGRALAKGDGLYDTRRIYQAAAIMGLLAILPYAVRSVWRRFERHTFPLQLAAACVTLLVLFIAARALSFHYMDKLLALGPGFIKLNGLIENAVVGGIIAAALLATRRHSSRRMRLQQRRSWG